MDGWITNKEPVFTTIVVIKLIKNNLFIFNNNNNNDITGHWEYGVQFH